MQIGGAYIKLNGSIIWKKARGFKKIGLLDK